jgi:hypothetical protein
MEAATALERSCDPAGDVLRYGADAPGLRRAEVALSTIAFAPHRHDRYALGITARRWRRLVAPALRSGFS